MRSTVLVTRCDTEDGQEMVTSRVYDIQKVQVATISDLDGTYTLVGVLEQLQDAGFYQGCWIRIGLLAR